MKNENSVERQHEKFVCDRFFRMNDPDYKFIGFGDDKNEPDCYYSKKGSTLGCEVSIVYYDKSDGKDEWTIARGERTPQKVEPRSGGTIWEPDNLFKKRLIEKINDKILKDYKKDCTFYLILEGRKLLLTREETEAILNDISVGNKGKFDKIFFIIRPANEPNNDDMTFEIK